jgi:probable phosphoglycerate mutase
MSRTILMIRHGPTKENVDGIFMGRVDAICPPESLSAAASLGRAMSLPDNNYIYTSPLQRCLSTVKAIFPGRVAQIDDRLTERDLGNWGGHSKKWLKATCPEAFLSSGRLNPHFTPDGGESLPVFCQRVASFLRMAVTIGDENTTIVVVSHNGVIRLARHLLEGMSVEQLFSEGEPHLTPSAFICDVVSNPLFDFRVSEICGGK